LTFSGAALDGTTVPTTVVADGTDCPGVAPNQCSTLTFGLLNADSGSAQFRVTEVDSSTGTTTVGLPVMFAAEGDLEFDPDAVAASSGVTITYNAETNNGLALDSGSGPVIPECEGIDCNARTTAYLQTGPYFGIDNDGDPQPLFDDTVDVNTARTTLVDGDDGLGGDEGGFAATTNLFPGANEAVVPSLDGHSPTFTGDFSWITDPTTAVDDGIVSVFGNCADASIVVTATEITADCLAAFATLRLDPAAQDPLTTLPAGNFTASTDVAYTDDWWDNGNEDVLTTGSFSVGRWDLNGYQAEVAYMPFQTGISQVIYFANRGAQTGEITVDWIDKDGSSGQFSIGDSVAGTTRAIGPAINAGLPAGAQEGGRIALTLTVNIPACDGQLNAQYNVSGDRAFSVARSNASDCF
jgi:hypothetical protein